MNQRKTGISRRTRGRELELIRGALELVEELDLVREAGGGMEAADQGLVKQGRLYALKKEREKK